MIHCMWCLEKLGRVHAAWGEIRIPHCTTSVCCTSQQHSSWDNLYLCSLWGAGNSSRQGVKWWHQAIWKGTHALLTGWNVWRMWAASWTWERQWTPYQWDCQGTVSTGLQERSMEQMIARAENGPEKPNGNAERAAEQWWSNWDNLPFKTLVGWRIRVWSHSAVNPAPLCSSCVVLLRRFIELNASHQLLPCSAWLCFFFPRTIQ